MSEQQKNKTEKPAFYIFMKDAEGNSKHIGAAFKHASGNGINIVIGKARYVAFPPKPKKEESA